LKPNGSYRELQIATIRDRIVQKAIEQLIRKQLNYKYNIFNNPASYAFIKTEDIKDYDKNNPQTFKGVRGALEKLKNYSNNGFDWALKADIINFFPSIDRNKLLIDFVFPALNGDTSINFLIEAAFKQEIEILESVRKLLNEEQLEKLLINTGLPQGSILSPLFSNVYLSKFDETISDKGFILIRYVDDFIIMTKTEEEAKRAYQIAKNELNRLGLKIHRLGKDKTTIQKSSELDFLGISYKNSKFYPNEKAFKRNIEKLQKYPKYKTLFKNLQSLQMLSQSWASTYYFCDNDNSNYEILNKELIDAVNKSLYKARLKPVLGLGAREMRRLGVHLFDNSIVTFNQKKSKRLQA
jgi:RNA-directed DNA polymerase